MADKLFRNYFNEKVTDTVLPVNAKVLIQDGTGEPTQINAGSIGAGQLVKVTENGQTGYRLKDADPANYGDIGTNAVDLSISESVSTTKGAIGDYSHASGLSTGASGIASKASGIDTLSSGFASHAEGNGTTASGASSHAEGSSTFARSFGEHSGGVNGTDYTPQSATGFDLTNRLVNYGNGIDLDNRSDAYTLFKNGMQKFFTAALNTITNAVKGCVMLDENARLNIHDGTAFKEVAFSDEVATAAQGVKADTSVQLTGAQTVAGVKTFSNNIISSGTVTSGSDISANGLTVGRGGGNVATNTANGFVALLNNTTGSLNTATGRDALRNNTTGGSNTANGVSALLNNTTGFSNIANGVNALRNNTTGGGNTANGNDALQSNTTGSNNIANGGGALSSNITGSSNTANGVSAGRFIGDGSSATIVNNSVFLGLDTRPLGNSQNNQIVIGHTAIGAGSNTVTLGNTAITNTILRGAVSFAQFTTATEPAYIKGAQFFNTTLNKMRIGGATAYETVTSS